MGLPPAWQGIFLCFPSSLWGKRKVETQNFTLRVGYICIQPIGNLDINNALNVVEMQSQAAWYTFKKRERQSSKNLVKIWAILNGDARQGKARRGNQRWLWGHLPASQQLYLHHIQNAANIQRCRNKSTHSTTFSSIYLRRNLYKPLKGKYSIK